MNKKINQHGEYLQNPSVDKPLEAMYQDLDSFSWEAEGDFALWTFFSNIILPPTLYEGVFLKGILICSQADFLLERFPQYQDLFLVVANSRSCSYPFSLKADGLCTLYPNPHREQWFRTMFPERKDQVLIPIQTADLVHEYWMAPIRNLEKDIDLLCVSRFIANKNLPQLARALEIYRKKYGVIKMVLPFDEGIRTRKGPGQPESILAEMESILGRTEDYIQFVPKAEPLEMAKYYSRSKVFVFTSLLEGKARVIYEALSCNTPVVLCRAYNQAARGLSPAIPRNAGLEVAFDPESIADGIFQAQQNHGDFKARLGYLDQFSGLFRVLQLCLEVFPYYRKNIPIADLILWLDLAIQSNYQASLHDFIYSELCMGARYMDNLKDHDQIFAFFRKRLDSINSLYSKPLA